jgi:transposase
MERKVALDIHRRSLFVLIMEEGKQVLRRRFSPDPEGLAAFLAVIQPGDRVVMEATTHAFRLAARLESVGATVLVLDPQETRAVGMKGKKTDYRDCLALLRYLDEPHPPAVWCPDRRTREIRQLTRERFAFNQSLVRLKNRVRGLLADEGLEPTHAPWEPAGRVWLETQTLAPVTRRILERELAAIAVETALKAEQEEELAQLALECRTTQRLMQLVGFGSATAVMCLGEVGDLQRFPSSKHLVSYAGLHASVYQSATTVHYGPITKAGRSQLRWIMVEVAWRHVHEDGPEAAYFQRLVQRGKCPQVAIVALARRLLVLVYTLLRREATHRDLDLRRYEAKLERLAAHRPEATEPEPCNRDWAADRLEELTGQTAPRRAASRPRRLRPTKRRAPAEGDPGGSSRRHGRGSASAARDEADAPRESHATPKPEEIARGA